MEPEEPAVETHIDGIEIDPVTNHRFDRLREVGYSGTAAAAVAVRRDIDLHVAVDLVAVKGCEPRLAADILL
jgi:hypothetical protein